MLFQSIAPTLKAIWGTETSPKLADLIYADSIIASRSLSFQEAINDADIKISSECDVHLCPILDFCNHKQSPNFGWILRSTSSSSTYEVCLVALTEITGEREVTISYGDKSSTEMMFSYGFCDYEGPDTVIIDVRQLFQNGDDYDSVRLNYLSTVLPSTQLEIPIPDENSHRNTELDDVLDFLSENTKLALIVAMMDETQYVQFCEDDSRLPGKEDQLWKILVLRSLVTLKAVLLLHDEAMPQLSMFGKRCALAYLGSLRRVFMKVKPL